MNRAVILLLPALITGSLYAKTTFLHLVDPYILKENTVLIGAQYDLTGVNGYSLNTLTLFLEYGVNENIMVGLNVPYHYYFGDPNGGAFGDASAFLKFSIMPLLYSDNLLLRLLGEAYFRFSTGISSLDSQRRIEGAVVNYYPFSTGAFMMSADLLFSLLLGEFMVNWSIAYESENARDESLLTFNLNYDRVTSQLSADYSFKLNVENVGPVFIRPAVYLLARFNLSQTQSLPDGFFAVLENTVKLFNSWQLKLRFSIPIFNNLLYNYDAGLLLGKYF